RVEDVEVLELRFVLLVKIPDQRLQFGGQVNFDLQLQIVSGLLPVDRVTVEVQLRGHVLDDIFDDVLFDLVLVRAENLPGDHPRLRQEALHVPESKRVNLVGENLD